MRDVTKWFVWQNQMVLLGKAKCRCKSAVHGTLPMAGKASAFERTADASALVPSFVSGKQVFTVAVQNDTMHFSRLSSSYCSLLRSERVRVV